MKSLFVFIFLTYGLLGMQTTVFASSQKEPKRKIRVLYFNYPPHIILTKNGLTGATVETWKNIAEKANLEIQWIGPLPYLRAQLMLEKGEGDAIVRLTKTPDREKKFIFPVKTAIWGRQGLAVLKSNPLDKITSAQELIKKDITIHTGGQVPEFFKANFHLFNLEPTSIDRAGLNIRMLLNKRIWGAYFYFTDVAQYYAAKEHHLDDIKFISFPGAEGVQYSYMALSRKADTELIRRITTTVNQEAPLIDYEKISQKYIEKVKDGEIVEDLSWVN